MKDFNNNGNYKNNKIDSHSKYTYKEVELFKKNLNRAKSYLAEQKKTLGYTYDTYILKLFFDYCFANGYFKIDVVEYVKGFEKKGFNLLLEANIGFCSWITNRSNARQAIANCLYRIGVDTSAPNVYEINGGPFDTIMPDTTNMITRFGNMFDTFDSHIEKHDGKVYKISETPESKSVSYTEEIPENSTFILRSSFSSLLDLDADDLDIISELAGTDNTLVTITDVPFVEVFAVEPLTNEDMPPVKWMTAEQFFEESIELKLEEDLGINLHFVNTKHLKSIKKKSMSKDSPKHYKLEGQGDSFGIRSK